MLLKSKFANNPTCRKHTITVCCTQKNSNIQSKFNAFIEKKRELDRSRWEKIKEISRTIDHIAKNDLKHTYDFIKTIHPVAEIEGTEANKKDNGSNNGVKSVDLADEESN